MLLITLLNGECGIPLPRFSGGGGNNPDKITHAASLNPSNLPDTIKPLKIIQECNIKNKTIIQ
jgi:hypothetical protein